MKTLAEKCWKRKGKPDGKLGGPGAPLDISQPIIIYPEEPWVQLTVGKMLVDFLVDMEATYSVLNVKWTKKISDVVMTTGVTEQLQNQEFLQTLECQLCD